MWSYYKNDCRNIGYGIPSSEYYGTNDKAKPLIIGVDTEYVQSSEGNRNHILSYQFHAFEVRGKTEWKGIHYLENQKKRLKLKDFIGDVITIGLKENILKEYPKEVFLCGHFNTADMPSFDDLPSIIKKMDSVRKTFVSLAKPLKINGSSLNRVG